MLDLPRATFRRSALPFRMPSEARPDGLVLRTRDAARLLDFYRDVLGLSTVAAGVDAHFRITLREDGRGDDPAGLVLLEEPDAPLRPRGTVGLYHFALLLPDRPALARAVARVLDAGWDRIDGAADHGVSEAFYLRDPEGNGIELYRDRDRSLWPEEESEVSMTTDPLDLDDLLSDAEDEVGPAPGREAGDPVLGHLHLHTADLDRARAFHVDALGLRIRQSSYPGALFLAAGDYHHHLGLNVWARGGRAPEGATGLVQYGWRVPGGTLGDLVNRLESVGLPHRTRNGTLLVEDPDGTEVAVREDGAG